MSWISIYSPRSLDSWQHFVIEILLRIVGRREASSYLVITRRTKGRSRNGLDCSLAKVPKHLVSIALSQLPLRDNAALDSSSMLFCLF